MKDIIDITILVKWHIYSQSKCKIYEKQRCIKVVELKLVLIALSQNIFI